MSDAPIKFLFEDKAGNLSNELYSAASCLYLSNNRLLKSVAGLILFFMHTKIIQASKLFSYCSVLLLLLFICAFLACGNRTAENISVNLNKTGSNQNHADSVSGNANNTNNKGKMADTDRDIKDTADFEGTAGIIDKKKEVKGAATLREVRTAEHGNYDRVVFEFEGAELPGYHIEYIDKPVRACGSGKVVPLKGDGWLEIRFQPAQAHTENGEPTVKDRERAPNHKIIKELKLICDFEADVEWVLGVASPNKYLVLELENPIRLAVDIKH